MHGSEYRSYSEERGTEQVAYPYSLSFWNCLCYSERSAHSNAKLREQRNAYNRLRDRACEHIDLVLALGTSGE